MPHAQLEGAEMGDHADGEYASGGSGGTDAQGGMGLRNFNVYDMFTPLCALVIDD